MAVDMSFNSVAAWPEPRAGRRARHTRAALLAALTATLTVGLLLPATQFRARALIGLSETSEPVGAAALKAAADMAVSDAVVSDAAQAMIGSGYPAPAPGIFERVSLVFDLGWVHPTSAESRIASDLATWAAAQPGAAAGTLEISVVSPDAGQSAAAASALARAFVQQSEATAVQTRRRTETEAAQRLGRLKAESIAARERFVALGGIDADPAQVHAAATAQVALAQTRVDALRAIIASGAPPMSDRRDVPPSIEALQTSYLDLSRQLSKALETLGERHTTVIALRDDIRRASSALTTEWRRLEHLAEAELGTARGRERDAAKAETAARDNHPGALAEARIAVEVADTRVLQAARALRDAADAGRTSRLISEADAPARRLGLAAPIRWLFAGLAGLLTFFVVRRLPALRARTAARKGQDAPLPLVSEDAENHSVPVIPAPAVPRHRTDARDAPLHREALMARLRQIEPAQGAVSTVMVVASDGMTSTTRAALAIARTAATAGYRTLVVAAHARRQELAATADPEACPVVIDLFGHLRIGLPAAAPDDGVYLAPGFADGERLAAGLAANPSTRLIDDIAGDFDFLVIDGGQVDDPAIVDWTADVVVHATTQPLSDAGDRICASLGLPEDAMIGSFVGSRFVASVPAEVERPSRSAVSPAMRPVQRGRTLRPTPTARNAAPISSMQRRKVGGQR